MKHGRGRINDDALLHRERRPRCRAASLTTNTARRAAQPTANDTKSATDAADIEHAAGGI
jgi:hypothetical protein